MHLISSWLQRNEFELLDGRARQWHRGRSALGGEEAYRHGGGAVVGEGFDGGAVDEDFKVGQRLIGRRAFCGRWTFSLFPTTREIVTVREALEMPLGNRTLQRRSLASTHSSSIASQGRCSVADWRMRKSGPICTTGMELPLSSKRIFTLAEWPL